ncbi:MAG TPA: amidohydrolase family protein [Spirochaetia bacterium]|nr:amidohydrolase family protein [Spirochaetia bacterium]
MVVDSHQHFIEYNPEEYGWISDDMAILKQDSLPDQLAAASAPVGIEATVAVEARQSLKETDWLLDIAGRTPLVAGVVGWVDLRDRQLDRTLDRYLNLPLLKGVRHVVHDEADPDFLLREDFGRGIAMLSRFGLTYDILIFSRHLPQTLRFVHNFPDQLFVIDHIAKPRIRDGEFREWRDKLRPIARCENVFCKLSGMVTEARPKGWVPREFRPYIETVIDLFGPDRVMFGSDWPVCTLEAPYQEIYGIVEAVVAELSPTERDRILGDTAAAFYKLSAR